jgi:Tfp pilus assembly protein PilO
VVNKVSFKGNFPQVLKVLQDVERLEQLLRIENLSLKPTGQKDRADLLQVDFDLVAYLISDRAPAAPAAAAPAPTSAAPTLLPPSVTSPTRTPAPTGSSAPSK